MNSPQRDLEGWILTGTRLNEEAAHRLAFSVTEAQARVLLDAFDGAYHEGFQAGSGYIEEA